MKEMDALLLRFLDFDYVSASTELQSGFVQLLACEDDVLWRWLSGRVTCPEPVLRDGQWDLPEAPGLGVEIDEAVVERCLARPATVIG